MKRKTNLELRKQAQEEYHSKQRRELVWRLSDKQAFTNVECPNCFGKLSLFVLSEQKPQAYQCSICNKYLKVSSEIKQFIEIEKYEL